MVGVISSCHLFTHSTIIVREFGFRCLARCVWRTLVLRRPVTFLECVAAR
jgi:hypothetical protein